MSLYKTIKLYLIHLLINVMGFKYKVLPVSTPEDFKLWLDLYKEIYTKELGIYNKKIVNYDFRKLNMYLLWEKNGPIGCLLANVYHSSNIPNQVKENYRLNNIDISSLGKIVEFRHFMIKREYRNTIASLVFMEQLAKYHSRNMGYPMFILGESIPGLLHAYSIFGVFFYADSYQSDCYGDLVIPWIQPLFDLEFLKKVEAPHYFRLKKMAKQCHYETAKTGKDGISISKIFNALSISDFTAKEALNIDQIKGKSSVIVKELIQELLRDEFLILNIKESTSFSSANGIDSLFVIVINGKFLMRKDGKEVLDLLPGSTFSEEVFLKKDKRRFFSVECVENGTILLVKHRFVKRVKQKPDALSFDLMKWLEDQFKEKMLAYESKIAEQNLN